MEKPPILWKNKRRFVSICCFQIFFTGAHITFKSSSSTQPESRLSRSRTFRSRFRLWITRAASSGVCATKYFCFFICVFHPFIAVFFWIFRSPSIDCGISDGLFPIQAFAPAKGETPVPVWKAGSTPGVALRDKALAQSNLRSTVLPLIVSVFWTKGSPKTSLYLQTAFLRRIIRRESAASTCRKRHWKNTAARPVSFHFISFITLCTSLFPSHLYGTIGNKETQRYEWLIGRIRSGFPRSLQGIVRGICRFLLLRQFAPRERNLFHG